MRLPGEAANDPAISTKNKHLNARSRHAVRTFMSNILNKAIVLVLNRNWQAINMRTPQEAFCMMATNVATGLEIEGEDHIRPVTWEEWITLPIRDQDEAVHTVRGPIRVPTVIVAVNFAKVPKKRPKLCARDDSRARRQPLPIHRPCAAPGRRQPRPRRAPLARWRGRLGEPRLVGQGSEPAQGRPPAARGRPEAAHRPACAEGTAGVGAHSQRGEVEDWKLFLT